MTEKIARLRISLMDTEPEIWRVVEVPLASSLAALHLVIQSAIGGEESHLYEFKADGQRYGLPQPGWAISRPPRSPSSAAWPNVACPSSTSTTWATAGSI